MSSSKERLLLVIGLVGWLTAAVVANMLVVERSERQSAFKKYVLCDGWLNKNLKPVGRLYLEGKMVIKEGGLVEVTYPPETNLELFCPNLPIDKEIFPPRRGGPSAL
jgi:hypothetical protein